LIAIITPDWNDPNVKNLVLQKQFLQKQLKNLENIITTTKQNFEQQLQSLNIQKQNLQEQIKILQNSLKKLQNQKNY